MSYYTKRLIRAPVEINNNVHFVIFGLTKLFYNTEVVPIKYLKRLNPLLPVNYIFLGFKVFLSLVITSNGRPLGCAIIYTDRSSLSSFFHRHPNNV